MDQFTKAYIEAALWSSTDDEGKPMDAEYSPDSLSPQALASMEGDCAKFQADNSDDIFEGPLCSRYPDNEQAGHDFWLTRNGHGCGFWDGDWPEPAAARLTDASKAFGGCNLYVGDDGMIYCE